MLSIFMSIEGYYTLKKVIKYSEIILFCDFIKYENRSIKLLAVVIFR